jgi:hypothetical protein
MIIVMVEHNNLGYSHQKQGQKDFLVVVPTYFLSDVFFGIQELQGCCKR